MSASLAEIARRIERAGGSILLVGGCVRDRVMGVTSKDIDIEAYGVSIEQLARAFEGLKFDLVGSSFGVIKVFFPDQDYDVSIPRRENKIGVGHEAFQVHFDPSMRPEEAAARRDFTMNSLAQRVDGEILDFYGGIADIQSRILRATSVQFAEDPLRVLRGMQFAARFNMEMDSDTAAVCRSMTWEFPALPRERVWKEFEKLLTRGRWISQGLRVLSSTGWLSLFPELHAMCGCLQDPKWHPEGDVFTHVGFVCDAAAEIANRDALNSVERLVLLTAALLHDVGKPATTVKNAEGRWTSPGHAEIGVRPAETFLISIGAPLWLSDHVLPLVREHMAHVSVETPNERFVRRLSLRCAPASLQDWGRVVEADHSGRPPLPSGNPAEEVLRIAGELAVLDAKPKPLLLGRDLIAHFSMEPGPAMGLILKRAFQVQLDEGWTELEQALAWVGANHAV